MLSQKGAISKVSQDVTVLQDVQVFGAVGVSKSFDSVRISMTEMGERSHLLSHI